MKDKSSQEIGRRGSRAAHDYEERTPRHKSNTAGSQDDREVNSPLPRHRSMTARPHERERDRDSNSYSQGRSSHASKIMSSEEAQKAIRLLFTQVKATTSFFANFKEQFEQEVSDVEAYAGQTILEKLWERRIRHIDGKSRSSKDRSKEDGVLRSPFHDVSNRLWDSINDAYEGARSHPSSQNNSLARKLDGAIQEFSKLLMSIRTDFQEMDGLIRELKLLKVVLELGGAGAASTNEGANEGRRAGGAAHGHLRECSQEREDARYEGTGEGSGSEDEGQGNEQHGEDSGGRDGSEVGGDGEVEGSIAADQFV